MTSGNSTDEAQRLFLRALRMDPEHRHQFLDDACSERSELREEVLSLLQHADDRPPGLVGEFWSESERSTVARNETPEEPVQDSDRETTSVLSRSSSSILEARAAACARA